MYTVKDTAWSIVLETFGQGLYHEYRIPGIVITKRGTILCYYESRANLRDDWGRIIVTVRRSEDDGKSWTGAEIRLGSEKGGTEEDTINNPTAIIDGDIIHMIFHQNYARAFCMHSEDDGRTWSEPAEITSAFREFDYKWNCCATGPGHGIAMQNGRLIAPIWLANGKLEDPQGKRRAHDPSVAGAIYSDDHGKTWHAGKLMEGLTDANETAAAELPDGRLLFNIRSRNPRLRRTLALSGDVTQGYDRVWVSETLNDPMCFGSMDRLPDGDIVFVNCDIGVPAPRKPDLFKGEKDRDARINLTRAEYGTRENLTVKVSSDQGETWNVLTKVDPVGGYADIAVHQDSLYVFYEYGPWEMRVIRQLILRKYELQKA